MDYGDMFPWGACRANLQLLVVEGEGARTRIHGALQAQGVRACLPPCPDSCARQRCSQAISALARPGFPFVGSRSSAKC